MTPLLVMALGLIPSYRAGLFSIGSEGQFGLGALTAGLMTLADRAAPPAWLSIVVAALAGALGGIAWALLAGLLRAYLHVDEILTTFAFNFIATFAALLAARGPCARRRTSIWCRPRRRRRDTWLPTLCGSAANIGLLLLPVLVLVVAAFGWTPAGYRVRLLGQQRSLAIAAGVRPPRTILWTMLLAGAAAGLAGWLQVAGVDRAVFASVFRGYGYLALALVALGRGKVLPTVIGAVLFAALQNGSEAMQLQLGVSSDFVFVMQGVVLFLMAFGLLGRAAAVIDAASLPSSAASSRRGSWPAASDWPIPTALAAIGEAVSERAGIFNLGLEGMMMMGAFTAFAVTSRTGSDVLGLAGGAAGGAALAVLMVVAVIYRGTNVIVTGFASTLLGQGLANFLYAQTQEDVHTFEPLGELHLGAAFPRTVRRRGLLPPERTRLRGARARRSRLGSARPDALRARGRRQRQRPGGRARKRGRGAPQPARSRSCSRARSQASAELPSP